MYGCILTMCTQPQNAKELEDLLIGPVNLRVLLILFYARVWLIVTRESQANDRVTFVVHRYLRAKACSMSSVYCSV